MPSSLRVLSEQAEPVLKETEGKGIVASTAGIKVKLDPSCRHLWPVLDCPQGMVCHLFWS